MKSKDIYFVSLGAVHLLIFFKLLDFARQLIAIGSVAGKQAFIIAFGCLVGVTVFLVFQNLSRLIQLLILPEDQVAARVVSIAQVTVTLLSFLMISTLLQNFIIFR